MNINLFFLFYNLALILGIIYLGIFVYLRDKKNIAHILFFYLTLVCSFWIISILLRFSASNLEIIILSTRFSYFFAAYVGLLAGLFCFYFPVANKNKISIYIAIFVTVAISLISILTDKIILNVDISEIEQENIFGKFYLFYFVYYFLIIAWIFGSLLVKRAAMDKYYQAQINFVLLGLGLGAFFGVYTNLVIPFFGGTTNTEKYGPFSIVFIIVFIAYAIIKYRLMDLKFTLRKSSVYFLTLITSILFIITLKILAITYFPEAVLWEDFIILIVISAIFPAMKKWFEKIANKYLFASIYDSRKLIADLSDNLRSIIFLDKLFAYIVNTLTTAMHCRSMAIMFYNEDKRKYFVKYKQGFENEKNFTLNSNRELQEVFLENNHSLVVKEMRFSDYYEIHKKSIDYLEKLGVAILIPLNVKYKTIGLIALGEKESGERYSQEDIEILEIVGAQAAVAIDNALKYEEVKNFSIKLEDEISKATYELREANVQLKKLDEAKSEFISIASHQLRTPLTVIKGYISMILEGSFGEISPEVKDSLDKVYKSNERLVKLVEELLNVSRIESGRMVYKFQEYYIEKVVESVVEELSEKAKSKGIKLEYLRKDKLLPKTSIDSAKIRQVVMNFLDNAIKYTNNTVNKIGKIKVSLTENDNKIIFCSEDNGIGISDLDLHNLFKKFSRGTGISVINTQGTGLGLYVAKEIIEAHNGRVWAESEGEGRGAKMCFEIPVVKKDK